MLAQSQFNVLSGGLTEYQPRVCMMDQPRVCIYKRDDTVEIAV